MGLALFVMVLMGLSGLGGYRLGAERFPWQKEDGKGDKAKGESKAK